VVTGAGDEWVELAEDEGSGCEEEDAPASTVLETAGDGDDTVGVFACTAAADFPASPGSWPTASWTKIVPQTAMKTATEPATTRLRSNSLRL
jgi:hypothetical protein